MEQIIKEFIKPELFILIPVLYLIGVGIKKSTIKNNLIPILLGFVGILLSAIYTFAMVEVHSLREILLTIFVSFTQGILVAGCSVYFDQIYKQLKKEE